MIEIGTEMSLADTFRQLAVGGRDDPDVDRVRLVGAQALDFAVLQSAQQLGLDGERQFADFVQEQRAAFRRLDAAGALAVGARESPLEVPEQFALGQRFGQGRAVDLHQRPAGATRCAMQMPGKQLLADTRLAQQQYGQFRFGHDVEFVQQFQQLRALSNDFHVALLAGKRRRGLAG